MSIHTVAELNATLLEGLTAGYSLQQIADQASGGTQMEFVIFDLNGRILLQAGEKDGQNRFPEQLLAGYAQKSDKLEAMFYHKQTVFFQRGDINDGCHLCRPIVSGGSPVGVVLVEYGDDRVLAEALAESFARLFVYFYRPSAISLPSQGGFLKAGLARELLLHGDDLGIFGEIYELRSGGISTAFRPGYAVAVLGGQTAMPAKKLEMAGASFARFVPKSLYLADGGRLLAFLYGLDSGNNVEKECVAQLEHFSVVFSLHCGLSSTFTDLRDRRGFNQQAEQALALGLAARGLSRVHRADALYTDILLSGASQRVGGDVLELSEVCRLAAYDEENQADYVRTLACYLTHGNKISPAAAALFIDRSTLKYRLQKIRDLLGLNFDDPVIAKRLQMGIAMHNIKGGW